MKTRWMVALAICSLLAACGGGGGGSSSAAPPPSGSGGGSGTNPPPSNPPTPPPTADIVSGVITGFGSVFIDGVRFDTSNASFSKDDDDATEDEFSVGMKVELRGDMDDGVAHSVSFEEDVKGPIDAINGDELTVLGQTVLVQPETVFDDNLDPNTLIVGDVLEVSGLRGPNDVLEASFIERKDDDVSAFKVIGLIRDLDTDAQTFRVGGLSVNYAAARLDDLAELTDDLLVEVKDENKAYSPGDFSLLATKIEPAGPGADLPDRNGILIRVEGLVTVINNDFEFEIGGTVVRFDENTQFLFGEASLLTTGTKVQIEGSIADDGAVLATKIKFARNSARVDGIVESVDANANRLTILGIVIEPRDSAEFEDARDDVQNFVLSDILPGDFLEVRGNAVTGRVLASEIERDDVDETSLRGPASDVDVDSRTLAILGVPIVTDANTQYEGFDDQVLSADAFFQAIDDGQTLVEADWQDTTTDPSVAVRELSLED